MIKIKSMTVEADGTGVMDFTFDSPEDLARLWALSVNFPDCGSDDYCRDPDDPTSHVYDGPLPTAGKPPIPEGVYYFLGNFYDMEKRQWMGMEFFKTWVDRGHEFPRAPQR